MLLRALAPLETVAAFSVGRNQQKSERLPVAGTQVPLSIAY